MSANRRHAAKSGLVACLCALAGLSSIACGGTGGAWLWWMTNPTETIKAEYELGKGRLVILIDDDQGWLADPAIRPSLTGAITKQMKENKVNQHVVPDADIVQLRKKDPKFEKRGAREIGQALKADQVLHINVLAFSLHHETVDPAYQGHFAVAVKVLNADAKSSEDVRLWPRSADGKRVEVTTELHTGKGSSYDEQLRRRLCDEMADKITKLFYDHSAPKPL
ncbi:MAG: hypothetical protein JXQ73_07235 [Phycisphaerae bacterium]|nr:hypothetical protein [Phycisphaerae bacterium]